MEDLVREDLKRVRRIAIQEIEYLIKSLERAKKDLERHRAAGYTSGVGVDPGRAMAALGAAARMESLVDEFEGSGPCKG